METAKFRTVVTFAALGALGFIVALSAAARAESITLVERAAGDMVTDTGAKDDSVGDILTFANELYDEANTAKVGSDNGYCFRTAVGKAWECAWTSSLADGQITVEGPFLDGKDSVLAITGGTGKYMNARGEMQLHARNAEGSEYDFKFNLAQ